MFVVMFVVGHQQFAHSAYKTKLSHELSTMETITFKLSPSIPLIPSVVMPVTRKYGLQVTGSC